MAVTANKKIWTEFIDIYHSLPSLWNTKDENYNNRESRSVAWNKLVEKLREVEPDANQDSVKRKINTFRSNFNREVRKIRHAQKEQPNELYNPTLWYFDHLSFLLNQEKYNGLSKDGHYDEEITLMGLTTAKSEIIVENETMQAESISEEDIGGNNDQNSNYEKLTQNKCSLFFGTKSRDKLTESEQKPVVETAIIELQHPEPIPLVQESVKEPQDQQSTENQIHHYENIDKSLDSKRTTNYKTLRLNPKRSKLRLKLQDPYNRHLRSNSLSLTDEAEIYGQSWACGFRKLSPQQRLFAKKAIDEILILGQLKALKLNTVPINANLLEETSDQG